MVAIDMKPTFAHSPVGARNVFSRQDQLPSPIYPIPMQFYLILVQSP